jgi:hypothetical protein
VTAAAVFGASKKNIVAPARSPAVGFFNVCRPLAALPRFVAPRKIVNAPTLVAESGWKFRFTAISTLSGASKGVTVTESPASTHVVELTACRVVLRACWIKLGGSTIEVIVRTSRLLSPSE